MSIVAALFELCSFTCIAAWNTGFWEAKNLTLLHHMSYCIHMSTERQIYIIAGISCRKK